MFEWTCVCHEENRDVHCQGRFTIVAKRHRNEEVEMSAKQREKMRHKIKGIFPGAPEVVYRSNRVRKS